ncbi:unnamed protein product [Merluccius merluccius]
MTYTILIGYFCRQSSQCRKGTIKVLNDLTPVALTPLLMKATERIIKNNITKATDSQMDPLQFAEGVDDAKAFIIDAVHGTDILAEKLTTHFRLDDRLTLWITNVSWG